MKQKLKAVFIVICLCMVHIGCGADDTVYLEQAALEAAGESSHAEENLPKGNSEDLEGASVPVKGISDSPQQMDGTDSGTDISVEESEKTAEQEKQAVCYVYVCGAVQTPGVYVLDAGSRIYEAVALAGGLTEEASADSVNQALEVSDGQMVRILTKEEAISGAGKMTQDTADAGSLPPTGEKTTQQESDGKININTASVSELMTLPGIGQKKAESIVSYRESNGSFTDVEQIMGIEGIKEGVYNRVKEYIKVK